MVSQGKKKSQSNHNKTMTVGMVCLLFDKTLGNKCGHVGQALLWLNNYVEFFKISTLQQTKHIKQTKHINKDLQCCSRSMYSFEHHCFDEKLTIKICLNQVENGTKMGLAFFVYQIPKHANVRKPESIKVLGETISSLRGVHNSHLSLVSRHTIVGKHRCAAICTMMLILLEGLLT